MNARRLSGLAFAFWLVVPTVLFAQPAKPETPAFYAELEPYLHHDFCAAIVIHPDRITGSPLGKSIPWRELMTSALTAAKLDATKAIRFADPAAIRRLTILIDPFPGGNVGFFPAAVIEYMEDTPGSEAIRALFPECRRSPDDGNLFIDLDFMAKTSVHGYVASPRTILIAPEPTLVKMRQKIKSPRNPLRLLLGTKYVGSEVIIEYASQPALEKGRELTKMTEAQLRADKQTDEVAKLLLLDVKSFSLHLELRQKQTIRANVRFDDRRVAAAISESLDGGLAMLKTAVRDQAARNELKKELEKELKNEVPGAVLEFMDSKALQDLVNAISLKREGLTIEGKVDFPKTALDFAATSTAKLAASLKPIADKGDWIAVFRSDDPKIWNKSINEGPNRFAVPLSRAPEKMKYLRLKIDEDRFVVIELTKDKLAKRSENGNIGWEGTNHFQWNGRHLGIYDRRWTDQVRGTIQILPLQNRGVRGWGFGNRTQIDDGQGYSWAGKRLANKTVFEIAVKSGPLTAAERKALLK